MTKKKKKFTLTHSVEIYKYFNVNGYETSYISREKKKYLVCFCVTSMSLFYSYFMPLVRTLVS